MRTVNWVLPAVLLCVLSFGERELWARQVIGLPKGKVASEEAPQPKDQPAAEQPKRQVPDGLKSARRTLRTFIEAMDKEDPATAVSALDFSEFDEPPHLLARLGYAERLKAVLDRLAPLDYAKISDDPKGPPVRLPPGVTFQPLEIAPDKDGAWRFSPTTVKTIDGLYKAIVSPSAALPERKLESEDAVREVPPVEPETKPATEPEPAKPRQLTAEIPDEFRSARRTMRAFITANEEGDQATAVSALDFSGFKKMPKLEAQEEYSRRLKAVIDRLESIDYAKISDAPEGPPIRFPPDVPFQPVEIAPDKDGAWKFTPGTVSQIDGLYEVAVTRPVKEEVKSWVDEKLFGNEIWRILRLFIAIFAGLIIGQVARMVLNRVGTFLENRGRSLAAVTCSTLARAAAPVFWLASLQVGIQFLVLEHGVQQLASTLIKVLLVLVVAYVFFRLTDVAVHLLRELTRRTGSTLNDMVVPVVNTALKLTVIVLAGLQIAEVLSDQPPSSLIAGLGVGGLALGLAAQDTIKNLFGSMMIVADRPFELGDRIVIDGHDGPVEAVGFRSTRIRTLEGHLVTVPNGEMASRTVLNIGKRPYIRRVMNIRLAYDTPAEKVERALEIVRQTLEGHEQFEESRPPRVFLDDFLDAAMNIKAFYWHYPPDYWAFCDFNERVNLQIIRKFNAEGIRFALPSQTLFLAEDPERPAGGLSRPDESGRNDTARGETGAT